MRRPKPRTTIAAAAMAITPAMRGQRGRRSAGMMTRGCAELALGLRPVVERATAGLCLNGTSTIGVRTPFRLKPHDSSRFRRESEDHGTVRGLRLLLNGHDGCARMGLEEPLDARCGPAFLLHAGRLRGV